LAAKNQSKKHPERILIVDDEIDILAVIRRGLELEGFEVDTNNNPLDVLKNYVPGKYDLLLLDIRMPQLNGFELYRKIRETDTKVKVCFITAFEIYFDEFRRVFPKIHVSCFIHKPITISQLAKAIREELTRSIVNEPQITQMRHKESEVKNG
jgi:two-component system catabolic regulation response regulator CreB/two-component system response regulator ChvI